MIRWWNEKKKTAYIKTVVIVNTTSSLHSLCRVANTQKYFTQVWDGPSNETNCKLKKYWALIENCNCLLVSTLHWSALVWTLHQREKLLTQDTGPEFPVNTPSHCYHLTVMTTHTLHGYFIYQTANNSYKHKQICLKIHNKTQTI